MFSEDDDVKKKVHSLNVMEFVCSTPYRYSCWIFAHCEYKVPCSSRKVEYKLRQDSHDLHQELGTYVEELKVRSMANNTIETRLTHLNRAGTRISHSLWPP